MSVDLEQFSDFFAALHEHEPFPWQRRLAEEVFNEGWPDCIDLPTASGKTACIDIAVFVLACQAGRETNARKVGRRIFFTVNRRVIVDEAFERAKKIACELMKAEQRNDAGILGQVARALRSINEEQDVHKAPPLDRTQLRGGIYRDRTWARSMTQPIVVCTTADQLGSRLLFRGYGVSDSMKPVHAALTACDSLILLDEAHVIKAFTQTLQLIERYRHPDQTSPAMRFVQMTATPAGAENRFELDEADQAHPILRARQLASKPAELVKLDKKKSVADEIVRRALAIPSDERKAIGIIVNRVRTAREIYHAIHEKHPSQAHLVIGRMRPVDRDRLQDQLRAVVGPDRKDRLDEPCFVVATQCLEVGADYDFDALITECASIDALRQRFGRLNRKGRKGSDGNPLRVQAAIVTNDASLVDDDPVYGSAMKETWAWLSRDGRTSVDFGISAFRDLWEQVDPDARQAMFVPASDAAVLLPAHLDFLCQTAPLPEPNPDVSFFIHGPQKDNAEVNVCWRADLGEDEGQWNAIISMLPPISPECMTVPLHEVRQWMKNEKPTSDADIAVATQDGVPSRDSDGQPARAVVIYRGKKEVVSTNDPSALRPGDTIVISALLDPTPTLGHVPLIDGKQQLDVAEKAYEKARRLRVVRVHEAIHPELPKELKDYATSAAEVFLRKAAIRELLGEQASGFTSGPDEIAYPNDTTGKPAGLLLRFNPLLPDENPLRLPDLPEDDGEDSSIESTAEITLDKHTKRVSDRVSAACDLLHLAHLRPALVSSADFHDFGKADIRFNAMLAGLTPFEAMERPSLLAKSGKRLLSASEYEAYRSRATLPRGFRHEMLSVQIVEHLAAGALDKTVDRNLLLHLIAAHHGHARPFAPVVIDEANDETRSIRIKCHNIEISPERRREWPDAHRLDSGIAERFWTLTRRHGWWGLAWLEAILRLADQQASAAEEKETSR